MSAARIANLDNLCKRLDNAAINALRVYLTLYSGLRLENDFFI